MNKNDIVLIICTVFIALILWLFLNNVNQNKATKAYVYYDSKLVKTINLTNNKLVKYEVDGYNGKIIIESKLNQIRVKEEISPQHLCSKQSWVSNTIETIVCLPNKVIIKLASSKKSQIDAIVR